VTFTTYTLSPTYRFNPEDDYTKTIQKCVDLQLEGYQINEVVSVNPVDLNSTFLQT